MTLLGRRSAARGGPCSCPGRGGSPRDRPEGAESAPRCARHIPTPTPAQGCAEIRWLAEKMGAKSATVSGLSGLGDIMLTCYGSLSRNRRAPRLPPPCQRSHGLPQGTARRRLFGLAVAAAAASVVPYLRCGACRWGGPSSPTKPHM